MNSIPSFIDFEASSLGSASYPIEVAWNIGETIEQYLIAPASGWTDWSVRSEALHGISRAELITRGESPYRVCERLSRQLAGRLVYSDNPEYDEHWLGELFAVCRGQTPAFRISDYHGLIASRFETLPVGIRDRAFREFEARRAALEAQWTGRHRAGRDVEQLLRVYRATVEVVEAFGGAPVPCFVAKAE